jgi:hypothetical protein
LTASRYDPRLFGIIIEPKERINERLGRSTDVGDALCLSLWTGHGFTCDIKTLALAESRPASPEGEKVVEYVRPSDNRR